MPLSFAPVRSAARWAVFRLPATLPLAAAANDDRESHADDDHILRAALQHFALHGLGAPHVACAEAETAWLHGDVTAAKKWLAICRTFDRRLAANLESRMTSSASATC